VEIILTFCWLCIEHSRFKQPYEQKRLKKKKTRKGKYHQEMFVATKIFAHVLYIADFGDRTFVSLIPSTNEVVSL
jgi:amino acid permease